MKKVVVCILSILCIALTILIIIRETTRERVDIDIVFVDQLKEEQNESIQFCAVDKYNNFNLIKIEIPEYIDDIYTYVFDLYNFKRNTLPLDYTVISNELLQLNRIKKEEDIIYIDIKRSNISADELNRIISALKITYRYLGIKDVVLTVEDSSIS